MASYWQKLYKRMLHAANGMPHAINHLKMKNSLRFFCQVVTLQQSTSVIKVATMKTRNEEYIWYSYILWHAKRYFSGGSNVEQWKISPGSHSCCRVMLVWRLNIPINKIFEDLWKSQSCIALFKGSVYLYSNQVWKHLYVRNSCTMCMT